MISDKQRISTAENARKAALRNSGISEPSDADFHLRTPARLTNAIEDLSRQLKISKPEAIRRMIIFWINQK